MLITDAFTNHDWARIRANWLEKKTSTPPLVIRTRKYTVDSHKSWSSRSSGLCIVGEI